MSFSEFYILNNTAKSFELASHQTWFLNISSIINSSLFYQYFLKQTIKLFAFCFFKTDTILPNHHSSHKLIFHSNVTVSWFSNVSLIVNSSLFYQYHMKQTQLFAFCFWKLTQSFPNIAHHTLLLSNTLIFNSNVIVSYGRLSLHFKFNTHNSATSINKILTSYIRGHRAEKETADSQNRATYYWCYQLIILVFF